MFMGWQVMTTRRVKVFQEGCLKLKVKHLYIMAERYMTYMTPLRLRFINSGMMIHKFIRNLDYRLPP